MCCSFSFLSFIPPFARAPHVIKVERWPQESKSNSCLLTQERMVNSRNIPGIYIHAFLIVSIWI